MLSLLLCVLLMLDALNFTVLVRKELNFTSTSFYQEDRVNGPLEIQKSNFVCHFGGYWDGRRFEIENLYFAYYEEDRDKGLLDKKYPVAFSRYRAFY